MVNRYGLLVFIIGVVMGFIIPFTSFGCGGCGDDDDDDESGSDENIGEADDDSTQDDDDDNDTFDDDDTDTPDDDDDDVDPSEEVWTDPDTGLMWINDYNQGCSWDGGCGFGSWGGYDDWRLPTISELRTIIRGCPATMTDGSCSATDANPEINSDCEGCPDQEGSMG